MKNLPQISDLIELEQLYLAAQSDSGKIKWDGHFPDYPEAIKRFFDYIIDSIWCNHLYKPGETSKLIKEIKTASIQDIQSILTAASRRERFCTGAWKKIMENDELSVAIQRAKEIIET